VWLLAAAPCFLFASQSAASDAQSTSSTGVQVENYLSWKGYYENQLAVFAMPRNEHGDPDGSGVGLLDYNKVRLGLGLRPLRGFSAQVDLVARTLHGSRTYHLADMLPKKFTPELALLEALDPASVIFELRDEFYIDNAYLAAKFWRVRLRIGKQPIRFGSGYLWNPTDPFNRIDLLDPSYEKRGINALRLQLFLPAEGLLEVYALSDRLDRDFHIEDGGLAARARFAAGRFVFAADYVNFLDVAGLDPRALDAAETTVRSRRHLLGIEITGELGGVGLWAEASLNLMPGVSWSGLEGIGEDRWFEALGGASYTFRGGVSLMAEYLYNGRGGSDSSEYTLWHWFAYLDQTLRTLGRHYASATLQVPVGTIDTTFAVTGIVNIGDPSFLINPSIRFDWNQYLSVLAYGAITWGGTADSEFPVSGQGGYLRFRFSF
jgi:hypothetical protein